MGPATADTTTTTTNAAAGVTWELAGSNKQCNRAAGEVYLDSSPGKVPSIEACQKACESNPQCQSISYFNGGWCSHFSTTCTNTKWSAKCTSMRINSATTTTTVGTGSSPAITDTTTTTTNAAAGVTWELAGSNKQCNRAAGEVYLDSSPGKVPSIEACQKACESNPKCQSISYFNGGWCSHFSTTCTNTKWSAKCTSMRINSATTTTTVGTGSSPAIADTTTTTTNAA